VLQDSPVSTTIVEEFQLWENLVPIRMALKLPEHRSIVAPTKYHKINVDQYNAMFLLVVAIKPSLMGQYVLIY
jgi:hypothetical protein